MSARPSPSQTRPSGGSELYQPVLLTSRRYLIAGVPGFWAGLSTRAKRFVLIALVAILLVIAIAVAVPVALTQSKSSSNKAAAADGTTSFATGTTSAPQGIPTGATGADWKVAAVGGDGSIVYTEDGSSFVYNNSFGKSSPLRRVGLRGLTACDSRQADSGTRSRSTTRRRPKKTLRH